MLDPRLQLMLITTHREREIDEAARVRLLASRTSAGPRLRSGLGRQVGLLLIRFGWWLAADERVEAGDRAQTA